MARALLAERGWRERGWRERRWPERGWQERGWQVREWLEASLAADWGRFTGHQVAQLIALMRRQWPTKQTIVYI